MKRSAGALLSILVLSLVIWVFFYVASPEPLDPAETVVVVGISAGVVYLSRWLWGLRGRSRGGNAHVS